MRAGVVGVCLQECTQEISKSDFIDDGRAGCGWQALNVDWTELFPVPFTCQQHPPTITLASKPLQQPCASPETRWNTDYSLESGSSYAQ